MIQFRWRRLKHFESLDPPSGVVTVDGHLCVLEYRQHFVPARLEVAIAKPDGSISEEEVIVLKPARECDSEWKPVVISDE